MTTARSAAATNRAWRPVNGIAAKIAIPARKMLRRAAQWVIVADRSSARLIGM
jgi:hypothetical protein